MAEPFDSIDKALMLAGDERAKKAHNELERARECRAHDEKRAAELAEGHAWALRNQADGLWEAAQIVRRIADAEGSP